MPLRFRMKIRSGSADRATEGVLSRLRRAASAFGRRAVAVLTRGFRAARPGTPVKVEQVSPSVAEIEISPDRVVRIEVSERQIRGVRVSIESKVGKMRFGSFDIKPAMLAKARARGKTYVDVPMRIRLPATFGRTDWSALAREGKLVFRRMSARTAPWKWWHPGWRGEDLANLPLRLLVLSVVERAIAELEEEMSAALRREGLV